MKHFYVKYQNSLSNPNSNYYKRFGGILTKLVSCKSKNEIYKFDKNSKNIIEIIEIKK
jgi:hypothetical protein